MSLSSSATSILGQSSNRLVLQGHCDWKFGYFFVIRKYHDLGVTLFM